MDFGNDAKPFMFELSWPTLQPVQRYQSASPDEIISWMKTGHAVNPNPNVNPVQPKHLLSPRRLDYQGNVEGVAQEVIYPFVHIELLADLGTNSITFSLNCPIIDTESKPK